MKEFLENQETNLFDRFKNIVLGLFIGVVWITLVQRFLPLVGYPQYLSSEPWSIDQILRYLFFAVLMAPITEELCFREAPLKIARSLGPETLLPTLLASSVIFGFVHGDGYVSVIKQGVLGFLFGCVYLKNGYNYWSSVILHAAWNFWCLCAY